MNNYGVRNEPNPNRDLYSEVNGVRYARIPIETPIVSIGDNLNEFIETYGKPYYEDGDIFCISAKVVSICNKYVVHESKVKVSWLARFIVKFVTKWPDDIGYSHPRKMQVAINMAGYPRILLAIVAGSLMKLFGKPGYFYRIAGHNINAIDGFNPVSKPPMNEYAVLPPPDGDKICDEIEDKFGMKTVILDGNNIDNNILGRSASVRPEYEVTKLMEILKGNPQGQEDDGKVTPILLVRSEY